MTYAPRVAGVVALSGALLLVSACAREAGPDAVAADYVRALYARDLGRAWQLVAAADQGMKDEASFRLGEPSTAALEWSRALASFVTAKVVRQSVEGESATVALRLSLPDPKAPIVTDLTLGWKDRDIAALSPADRAAVTRRLEELGARRGFPMIEAEQRIGLTKDAAGWRTSVGWAGAVRVAFETASEERTALQVAVQRVRVVGSATEAGWIGELVPFVTATRTREALVAPGERVHVVVSATNTSARPIAARVAHRIEPPDLSATLVILRCPLLVPVTIAPGAVEEFASEYVLSRVPGSRSSMQVVYEVSR